MKDGGEDTKSSSGLLLENDKVEKLRRNEIINCICGITEEDGLMIQVWERAWEEGKCEVFFPSVCLFVCSICKSFFFFFFQCDICLCWQHGHCAGIFRETDVPDKYTCAICKNPYRGRPSMKYLHDQEWLKEGTLPR